MAAKDEASLGAACPYVDGSIIARGAGAGARRARGARPRAGAVPPRALAHPDARCSNARRRDARASRPIERRAGRRSRRNPSSARVAVARRAGPAADRGAEPKPRERAATPRGLNLPTSASPPRATARVDARTPPRASMPTGAPAAPAIDRTRGRAETKGGAHSAAACPRCGACVGRSVTFLPPKTNVFSIDDEPRLLTSRETENTAEVHSGRQMCSAGGPPRSGTVRALWNGSTFSVARQNFLGSRMHKRTPRRSRSRRSPSRASPLSFSRRSSFS